MLLTLSVVHIPASNDTVVLVGMFVTPATVSGGGGPLPAGYTPYCGLA